MTDELLPSDEGPSPGAAEATEATTTATTAAPPDDLPAPPRADDDVELLGLIDRLAALIDRSDLTELEVEAGGTGLVLRKPGALAAVPVAAVSPAAGAAAEMPSATGEPPTAGQDPAVTAKPSVKAPLTGIFYASPAPGSAPYVAAGGEVAVGQIIGLIEAMKLFNEIKSDLAGRVVRVVPESGTLVKAKQPLIEVEPL